MTEKYQAPRRVFLLALKRIKRENPSKNVFFFPFALNDAEVAMLKRHVKRHHPGICL